MARPRKPTEQLKLSGAFTHNPARAQERMQEPRDERPLGQPAETMRPDQRLAWLEIDRLAPWLSYSDRIAVEIAASLLARFRLDASTMEPAYYTRLETMLGRLGLTPSDRSKVSTPIRTNTNRFANNGRRP